MIDFKTYEEVKLEDVAEFGRAKADMIYPAGTSTLQISASRGQVGFLSEEGCIASKDVAIIPQAGINPKYFNVVLKKNVEAFMSKYATGINIQEHEIGNFPIQVHNQETQHAVVLMIKRIDDEEQNVNDTINAYQKMKQTFLSQMMV
ncbi:restriction endonuclease subunit S [Companilactobacillus sp.]|uniref:restriction endonuclease subunit S n=1 Tax=Companilactobacillus sp. TaxID=2767905 RepID=UPI0026387E3B|nr:restriction endonuclease subunit S [Companilactobacillus sp.]